MKIIHTADWHLGQMLYNNDRSREHLYFFDKLREIVLRECPDVLVVCGDIFHTSSPSASILKLYNDSMLRIHNDVPQMKIVVTAGNHDSSSRTEADSGLWEHFNVDSIGYAEADFARHVIPVGNPCKGYVLAVPHCYPQNYPVSRENTPVQQRQAEYFADLFSYVKEHCDNSLPIIMTAHLAFSAGTDQRNAAFNKESDCKETSGKETSRKEASEKEAVDTIGGLESFDIGDFTEGYDYLALGHIHRPMNVTSKARYCGSPIAVSFDEDYPHSVTIVQIERHGDAPLIRTEEIKPLIPVLTLPAEPAVFEEALEALRVFPSDKEAYIRLNVLIEDYLSAGCGLRAAMATKDKSCIYCCMKSVRNTHSIQDAEKISYNTEEIREMNPLDIARRHYMEKNGREMDKELVEMMKEAME